jgi:hypothetical protein
LRRNLPAVLLAATIAALIAAGCGGGSSTSSGSTGSGGSGGANGGSGASSGPITTSSLSKAQFVKRANALCTRDREERTAAVKAYAKEGAGVTEGKGIEGAIEEVYAPSMESEIAELRRLGAPRGDENTVEAIIVALETRLESTVKGGLSNRLLTKTKQAEKMAGSYGLTECHG